MKTEQQYFSESPTIQQYMDNMSQLKEESFTIYEKFEVPQDGFIKQLQQANVHILAITEDWCGDAMLNNPIIRKVAEAAGVEVRTALRDVDTDLIDRHLTNGGRAIPIYVFLNEAGEVVGKWGPRAPELQAYVTEGRNKLPAQDDPHFKEKSEAFYTEIRDAYVETPVFWKNVYDSFKEVVKAAI